MPPLWRPVFDLYRSIHLFELAESQWDKERRQIRNIGCCQNIIINLILRAFGRPAIYESKLLIRRWHFIE